MARLSATAVFIRKDSKPVPGNARICSDRVATASVAARQLKRDSVGYDANLSCFSRVSIYLETGNEAEAKRVLAVHDLRVTG